MTKNEINSFVIYHSYANQIRYLTDEECGKLFRAMLRYSIHGTVDDSLSTPVQIIFACFRDNYDRDRVRYLEKCEKNAENGKKGGRPPKLVPPPKSDGFLTKTKKAYNDNGNENENDNENDNGDENGNDNLFRSFGIRDKG